MARIDEGSAISNAKRRILAATRILGRRPRRWPHACDTCRLGTRAASPLATTSSTRAFGWHVE